MVAVLRQVKSGADLSAIHHATYYLCSFA